MKHLHWKEAGMFALTAALVLSGCGMQRTEARTMEIAADTRVWEETWEDGFGKTTRYDLKQTFQYVTVNEESIVGAVEDTDGCLLVYYSKQNGEPEKEVRLPSVSEVQFIMIDEAGIVYLAAYREGKNLLFEIDAEGSVRELGELTLEDAENVRFQIPKGLYTDGSGRFYVWYEMALPLSQIMPDRKEDMYGIVDRIYVKDEQMQTLFYEQVIAYDLIAFDINDSGTPVIWEREEQTARIRFLGEKEAEEDQEVLFPYESIFGSSHGQVCIRNGVRDEEVWFRRGDYVDKNDDVYCYDYETGVLEPVLRLSTYGITPSDVLYMEVSPDRIEILDNHPGHNTEYTVLEKGKSEITTIMLGTIIPTVSLIECVTEFNRMQSDMRVQLYSYDVWEDAYEAGVKRLDEAVRNGAALDIIEVQDLNYEVYGVEGKLENLLEYMVQDETCNMQALMPSVLEVYRTNGRLFNLAPAFQIYSMWGKKSVLGDQTGVSFSKLMQILESNGADINAIFGFSQDETRLTTLLTVGMDRLVDWDKGKCEFESQEFLDMLVFVNEYTGGYRGVESEGIAKDQILLTVGMIHSVSGYQVEKELYGEELQFIGYPTQSGSGTALSYRGDELAISSSSLHKTEAWEFIKYYVQNGYDDGEFPVLRDQFDDCMNAAMRKQYVLDAEGKVVEQHKEYYQDSYRSFAIYSASQEDVDAVRRLVDSADTKFKYYPSILDIVNEEAESYFNGESTVKETAKTIQSRVTAYMRQQLRME